MRPARRALGWMLLSAGAAAQTGVPQPTTSLAPVVVTATRVAVPTFDVPASITRIDGEEIRNHRAAINVSESLGAVPGLVARDRQNYAQDVQISVRGFGARATFGIRGVRLYVDGIPATFPDGQGQISNVDLGSVDRIEILRGPFSALYGNSSGGVLQVFTETGQGPPAVDFNFAAGSDGVRRAAGKFSGADGALGYLVSASHFETDGYREHSAARRNLGNARLDLRLDDSGTLTLIANHVALPEAKDPLGLTRAQFEANPRGADPAATRFDTRKSVGQDQMGLIYERRVDTVNSLRVMAYTGQRSTLQFQAIPAAPQANPTHPGGVIALASHYRGADLRWTARTLLAERQFTVVAGMAFDTLEQHRLGYQNFIGSVLGVQGERRRDERNRVSNADPYLQAMWQLAPQWSINAGVRRSSVRFDSVDHYIVGSNGDDSGRTRYAATLPVLGVMYAPGDSLRLYVTAGRGFETPTFNELAYRPDGTPGLNFALQSARSKNIEVGVKMRAPGAGEITAAVFQTRTRDEIVTLTNLGGRSTFQNAGSTQRAGLEVGWSNTLADHLRAQVALTYLDATYQDGFNTCTAAPCAVPNVAVAVGNRIPGVARGALFAALSWAPALGWRAGVEGRYLSRVFVNDLNSDAASSHVVASANLGYVARLGPWRLNGFVRADNLFARQYAGSVIVNEGNSRFFEAAPGRSWLAGVGASASF